MLDAFLVSLNVVAVLGYGTIPLDVFFPERAILASLLPPGTASNTSTGTNLKELHETCLCCIPRTS